MAYEVSIETVDAQVFAAIPVHVAIPEIATVFPTLDRVWDFARRKQLATNHNVFAYRVESGMAHLAEVGRAGGSSRGEGRTQSDTSWEVYRDWDEDEALLRTDVFSLLA